MVIKKYGNRRLYDTTESRYITMEELADRIRAGEHVTVLDAKTNKDLTQQTLAHIILESRGAAKLLPVPLLEQLIRMGDDALTEFFGMYLSSALELYLQARQGAQAILPYNPFAQLPPANPFARMFGWGPPPSAPRPASPPPEPPRPPEPKKRGKKRTNDDEETSDSVAALRRELEEIKAALRQKARSEDE
jgi:polyhydroxyalkanoate synthesis repressor PhaR